MEKHSLYEYVSFTKSRAQLLEEGNSLGGKDLYMKGIFIQGDIRNQNQRIYPTREIARAVNEITKKIIANEGSVGRSTRSS